MAANRRSTVDAAEVKRFAAIAPEWWNENGAFRPLHRLNPARIEYLRDRLAAHFERDIKTRAAFAGLSLLDIGCGGGLICEPMARLGAHVTGIDAADRNIATARLHAGGQELAIDYRSTTAEALAETGAQFDIVLALEIVEHVADVDLFLRSLSRLAKPGGLVFVSTLNRTAKAWALAIAGAEYVMRWLPRGTHDWRKFLKPSELVRGLRHVGVEPQEIVGVVYSPISREWSLHKRDLDVNYMLYCRKCVG
jgi:2-polyprenyl-6-hydroxyphenyl methylase/3-demethylubiquinone-9 3-methyltransferase